MGSYKYDWQEQQNAASRRHDENMMYANARLNEQAAAKQQEYNLQNLDLQQQFQRDEWTRQFNMENAEYQRRLEDERQFNSIGAQIARAEHAGINAAAVIGTGSSSNDTFSAPSPSSVGAPSVPSSSVPSLSHHVTPPTLFDSTDQFLNVVKGVAELNKAGMSFVDQYRAQKMFMPQLEYQMSLIIEKDLQNRYQGIQNIVAGKTHLQKALNDLALQGMQGLYTGQLIDESKAKEFLDYAQGGLSHEQYTHLAIETPQVLNMFNSLINMYRSQAANNFANARNTNLQSNVVEAKNFVYEFTNIDEAKRNCPEYLRNFIAKAMDENSITQADAEQANH